MDILCEAPTLMQIFCMWFLHTRRESQGRLLKTDRMIMALVWLSYLEDFRMSFNLLVNEPRWEFPTSLLLNHCIFIISYCHSCYARWLIHEKGSNRIFLEIYFNKVSEGLNYFPIFETNLAMHKLLRLNLLVLNSLCFLLSLYDQHK